MNEASERLKALRKKWFIYLEFGSNTSENDINDMVELLEMLSKRYNMRSGLAIWREKMEKQDGN